MIYKHSSIIKIQENISLSDIKKLIMDNYNINEQDAIDQINSYGNEAQQTADRYEYKKLNIAEHPGFKIIIKQEIIDKSTITYKKVKESKISIILII